MVPLSVVVVLMDYTGVVAFSGDRMVISGLICVVQA